MVPFKRDLFSVLQQMLSLKTDKSRKYISPTYITPGRYNKWRKLSYYGALPFVLLVSLIIYDIRDEPVARPKVKYPHMNIHTKRYPWGNGKHSFFFNPEVNEDHEEEHHYHPAYDSDMYK